MEPRDDRAKKEEGAMQWVAEVKHALPHNYTHVAARVNGACRVPGLQKHAKASWMEDAVMLKSVDSVPITRRDIALLMKGLPDEIKAQLGEWKPRTELVELIHKEPAAQGETQTPAYAESAAPPQAVRLRRERRGEDDALRAARKALHGLDSELSSVENILRIKEKRLLEKLEQWRLAGIAAANRAAESAERQVKLEASEKHAAQKEAHGTKMKELDAQERRYADAERMVATMARLYGMSVEMARPLVQMLFERGIDPFAFQKITATYSAFAIVTLLTAYRKGDPNAVAVVANEVRNREGDRDIRNMAELVLDIKPLPEPEAARPPLGEGEIRDAFKKVIIWAAKDMSLSDCDETLAMLEGHCSGKIALARESRMEEVRDNARKHSSIDDERDSRRKRVRTERDMRIEGVETAFTKSKGEVDSVMRIEGEQELARQRGLEKKLAERAAPFGVNGDDKKKLRARS